MVRQYLFHSDCLRYLPVYPESYRRLWAVAYDTGTAVVRINRRPDVVAGGGSFYSLPSGVDLCGDYASDPDDDNLTFTTTMGKIVGNNVCLWSGGEGRRQLAYNVIATDPCGTKDTALYLVNVLVNMVPVIQVPTPTPQTHLPSHATLFHCHALLTRLWED